MLKDKGISQKELAEKIGVTNVTVSRWANGTNVMSDYHIKRIHDEFPAYGYFEISCVGGVSKASAIAMKEKDDAEKQLLFDVIALSFPGEIETLETEVNPELSGKIIRVQDGEGNWKPLCDKWTTEYKLSHNDKILTLSGVQMEQFKDEIRGYIAMRLNQMFERGCW